MDPLAPDFANTPVSPKRPHFHYVADGEPATLAVTIVTPYYNTGEIFFETAQSLLQQSLQQWEWLIVNDGSDDPEALRVLDEFRSRDPRIRVIDLDRNQGLPAARNAGIQQASAENVFFLDSDDLIEPTALEKMAWCLESYSEFGCCKGLTVAFGAQQYASKIGFENRNQFLQQNPITILAMVRRSVLLDVEGFDESLRTGLEDWDFWLRCAVQEHWGRTVPEYFDWFRRRQDHGDRWASWTPEGEREVRRKLKQRYPELFADGLPMVAPQPLLPYGNIPQRIPFANTLTKKKKRILFILPWMAMGGADKFNLDSMSLLRERGYEISIATTLPANYAWFRQFARLTPDIFVLPHFLRLNDYPRFLHYLIRSRNTDLVLVSNSELGYKFLPYLRAKCPETTFVDYCHMEEEYWHNGGHPRSAVAYQEALDLNIVSSHHLKDWMVSRGADPSRIETCYTNIDAELYSPDSGLRSRTRADLHIPPDIPVLLYAGRLCEQKQPKVFASVMRNLKGRKLRFICLVAGDGEDRRWLSRYLRRHRLKKHVRMLGAVKHERMRELLAASDIFFLPSRMEGISLAIYEAMSMGIVPVSAEVGGQSELVTPDCGVLVRRGSHQDEVDAYSDVLESLIRSPERRESLGKAARDRVCTQFRLEQMGDRMDHLLELAQHSHRPPSTLMADTGLATEHAVLAIECERISQVAGPLWKYQKVQSALWRISQITSPLVTQARRLAWHLRPLASPVRKAKDVIWILGHRLKVRMRESEEYE
jgi:glycosyltransferase involved in cell wall biosynthesis